MRSKLANRTRLSNAPIKECLGNFREPLWLVVSFHYAEMATKFVCVDGRIFQYFSACSGFNFR